MTEFDINAVNEQRIKLGLPVPDATDGPTFRDTANDASSDEEPANTLEIREAAAHDNWQKVQAERGANKERKARKQAAKKAREREQRHKVLKGRTFSDDEEEDLSTQVWLAQQTKRQKKIAAAEATRKAEEAKTKEAQYTSKDLKGVKVSHQLNEFDIDTEQILTLKDRNVGEESEEDELENADLLAKEKLQEKLESEKRKLVYNPLDDDDDDGTSEKKILAKYNEVIDGKKRHHFTFDGKGSAVEQSKLPAEDMKTKIDRILVELDDLPNKEPASDYKKEKKSSEIKFKKRAKNPNTVYKKKTAEDALLTPEEQANLDRLRTEKRTENGNDAMEVDSANPNSTAPISRKRRFAEMVFDDDDLQLRLAAQRREENNNRKKWAPGEFAKYLRSTATEKSDESKGLYYTDPTSIARIVNPEIDSLPGNNTADFSTQQWLDTLDPEKYWEQERKILQAKQAEANEMERLKNVLGRQKEGDVDMFASDEEMGDRDDEKEEEEEAAKEKGHTVTDDVDISQGLGATLKMLKERNLLDTSAPEGDVKDVLARNQFLAEQKRRRALAEAQAQLERERHRERMDFKKMSKKDQEEYNQRQNVRREEEEAAKMAELFEKDYKPNVQLKYLDEFNRQMTPKEAFKELSHQFHGKGSGPGKREKKLKKIEEERKALERSTLDMSKYANAGRSDADERGAGFSMGN